MNKTKHILAIVIASQVAFTGNLLADDSMKSSIKTSDGSAIRSSSGECISSNTASSEMQSECADVQIEVVGAPTAGTISTRVMDEVVIGAGMLFAFNSAELSDDAKAVIDERIERVRGRVKLISKMIIEGHTDSVGSDAYNMALSKKRAEAVADYIANNSYRVKAEDIEVVAKGESEPAASNDTAEGREINRRVVILTEGVIDRDMQKSSYQFH